MIMLEKSGSLLEKNPASMGGSVASTKKKPYLLMCVIETVPTQKLYKFGDQQHAHFRNTAGILCHSLIVLLVVSNISPSFNLCRRAIKLTDPRVFSNFRFYKT